MLKKTLQALAATLAISGLAQASDSVDFVYVAYEAEPIPSTPMTCEEARKNAWFERELARSDGDTNPSVKQVSCRHEILAAETASQSTADID